MANPNAKQGKKPYRGKNNRSSDKTNNFERKDNFRNGSNAKDKRPAIKDVINDITWYAKNPQLLKDAASVPFSQMLGLDMNFGKWDSTANSSIIRKMPGLVLLPMVPCYGAVDETNFIDLNHPASALNVAAQNLYSWIRHFNSGHSNYDPSDLMVYIAAMDQVYSFHAELVRLYGLMRFYSGFNRYMGRYLVRAMEYDYENILSNLSRLRYAINTMAAKISTFAVPAVFPMFERHKNIYSALYMDRPSVKAQIYGFIPAFRGIYNEPVDADGVKIRYKTGLKVKNVGWGRATLRTIEDIESDINEMLNPLLGSEDIGIMSGDILKAYGVDKCYHVNALPEDWIVGPAFIPTVLKQIHNLVTVGTPNWQTQDSQSMMLWQNGTSPVIHTWSETNNVIPMFYNTDTAPGNGIKKCGVPMNPHLLDTDMDSPDPTEIMEITRLMAIPSHAAGTTVGDIPLSGPTSVTCKALRVSQRFAGIGADAASAILVYGGDPSADRPGFTVLHTHTIVNDGNEGDKFFVYRDAVADLSKFDWHPTLYEYGIGGAAWTASTAPTGGSVEFRVTSDLNNCIAVDGDTIARMHDVALMSLLDVPTVTLSKGI